MPSGPGYQFFEATGLLRESCCSSPEEHFGTVLCRERLSVSVFWSPEIITLVSEPRLTEQLSGYHSSSDLRRLGKGKTLNLPFSSKIKSYPQSLAPKSIRNLGRVKRFRKNLVMHTVASLCI
ncbi:hypothetical protein M9H77_25782 [Catharanthus roseus]|uniref:Uncharacterized protein n=1 Tax=Catharanthus roseus TaxID=4058 RepID=A0ACC0A8P5_CATRO|nr:hypothetical protein M9H77_25782 [Catharanthus roseus]